MSSSNQQIGFSNININKVNGGLSCSFRRAKTVSNVAKYFNISKSYYILTAIGSIDNSGN